MALLSHLSASTPNPKQKKTKKETENTENGRGSGPLNTATAPCKRGRGAEEGKVSLEEAGEPGI